MSAPPIPTRLADRPTVGGLVVPWISMRLPADGGAQRYFLGQTWGLRMAQCVVDGLCQVCGQRLDPPPYTLLVTDDQLERGHTEEPAMHRECAAYSIRACPMVAGQMASYAKHQIDHTGKPCTEPGCQCGGWVSDTDHRAGAPARPWFQLWVSDYAISISDAAKPITVGNVNGLVWATPVIKIRPIRAPTS